ncbi:membrane protein insertion efficiency factor YidD [Nesterenkonia sedimenti]|uniref:membrane protein insertion efficiency factor YidD n=1 Tax=Nesterenkonia sedimenti TaxID=1463632 RepID=UPI0038993113
MTHPAANPNHETEWVRHRDFYTEDFDADPSTPAETPDDETQQPQPAAEAVTAEEIRRGHWGALREAPSILLVLFIKAWRKLLSPLYGDVCSFYPSCSAYGLEAVTVHGLMKGAPLTAWRILRCNPWSGGGIDHVPPGRRVWPRGKVPKIVVLNHPSIPRDPD